MLSESSNQQRNPSSSSAKQRQAAKVAADHSSDFQVDKGPKKAVERETDEHRITQRLKQIEYGKNTLGYAREARKKTDPQTPDPYRACSKRAFEGEVKKWRRLLHEWDPPGEGGDDDDDALGGRKRGRDKPCSPDENAAPKRQTLSGGGGGDLFGDWDEDEVQL